MASQEGQIGLPENHYAPAEGWQLTDFPLITTAVIPYTSNAAPRPDPFVTITPDGWLFIESGNIRLAVQDRDQWGKLSVMVTRMYNSWQRQQAEQQQQQGESDVPHPPD